MFRRLCIFAGLAFLLASCGTTTIWPGANKATAAILSYSSDFTIDSIDGHYLKKKDFSVRFGSSRVLLPPGFHSITCYYDNGWTYTTKGVFLTHDFEANKKYELFVYDKKKGSLRLAIREDE